MQRSGIIVVLLWTSCVACRGEGEQRVTLVYGSNLEDRVEFVPLSSYAEYVEFTEVRRELRITLASYATSCTSFVSPRASDAGVTITIVSPASVDIGPGNYFWSLREFDDAGQRPLDSAYALPAARVGHRGIAIQPGGNIELSAFAKELGGRVRGVLDFEFPGDIAHPASALKGKFDAKLCRVQR
jgi:hypothetical protein